VLGIWQSKNVQIMVN